MAASYRIIVRDRLGDGLAASDPAIERTEHHGSTTRTGPFVDQPQAVGIIVHHPDPGLGIIRRDVTDAERGPTDWRRT